jgi:phosphoglycolate phosphatase-like HAD superfamily hydrolase
MSIFSDPKRYFVGIDSDGCAFDTMELKHRKVFIPQAIESLGFEQIADTYRRTAETVNLYSRTRGANRFEAIATCLDIMRKKEELACRVPDPSPIWEFVKSGRPLSNDSFAEYLNGDGTDLMKRVLHWSSESNRKIAAMVVDNPPFPGVSEALKAAHAFANTMVVSATPAQALEQEWGAAGLLPEIDKVAGQEFGPKKQQLAAALEAGFEREKALMVGDAPGDHAAAEAHGICFFPIVPGQESDSWAELNKHGLRRLREGSFAGEYQRSLLNSYYTTLDAHSQKVS